MPKDKRDDCMKDSYVVNSIIEEEKVAHFLDEIELLEGSLLTELALRIVSCVIRTRHIVSNL